MPKNKKYVAWLLVIILCFGVMPVNMVSSSVFAAQEDLSSFGVQLTEQQKEIYDALVNNYIGTNGLADGLTEQLTFTPKKSIAYGSQEKLEKGFANDLNYAVTAFLEDYPQVFWSGGHSAGYSIQSFGSTYQVTSVTLSLVKKFTITENAISQFNTGVQNVVNEIQNSLPANATMFDKYMAIHDWICEKAYYNDNGQANPSAYPETHTAYPIFGDSQDGGVVCEGYAKAYKILCDQMGLTCLLVTGTAISNGASEAHMWNKIKMSDGKWYVVDATWDDGDDGIRYEYFLCGEQSPCFNGLTFIQDHIKDNTIVDGVTFEYPEISEYGYNQYLGNLSYTYNKGTLTISGDGIFPSYVRADRTPWYQYMDEITTLVVGDGFINIPEGYFADYDHLENLVIPYVGLSKDASGENAVLGSFFGTTDESGTLQYDSSGYGSYYDIPSSLKKVVVTADDNLATGAFCNCNSLQSVVLNDGIGYVAEYSFYNCSSIMELVIPDSVVRIDEYALYGCENLKRITLPFIGSNVNASGTYDAVLGYVFGRENDGTVQYYGDYGYPYAIPNTLQSVIVTNSTTIPYGSFYNCSNITEVQLQTNISVIDANAFRNCSGLQNITFMGDAPSIGSNAFRGCGVITANVLTGNHTWTDSMKQNYEAETINWNIKNPTDLAAKIDTAKISLGDKISVKFMVTLDESVSDDDYMNVTVNGETTTIKVKDTTVAQSNLNGKEKHVFVCEVNAKEMTKPIQAQMVVNGVAGTAVNYSVKKYADVILDLASGTYEAEKTMIRAMLNYGGYAQKYFVDEADWESEVFANANIYDSSTDPVLNSNVINLEAYAPSGMNVEKLTATLLLESETELRFYFTPENGKNLSDYSCEVSGTNKKLVTGTKNGQCYVSITGIYANELQDMYTVTIRIKDTDEVFATVRYGALSYVRTILDDSTSEAKLKNLVKALYFYNQAAVDYGK